MQLLILFFKSCIYNLNSSKETGIGQRRWWDLYYGRKSITGKEYTAVAEYLGITIQEAFESRQLELFEEK